MATANGTTTQDEWRTAGRPKSNRTAKATSQPNEAQSLSAAGAQNGKTPMNGRDEPVMAIAVSENGSAHPVHVQQNGSFSNGHYSKGHGGRQNGYDNRPRHSNFNSYNSKPPKVLSAKEDAMNKRKQVEKEIKNLGKHDAAAERVGRLFNEEIEKSQDRMRRAFQEMRQLLNDREHAMMKELESCKMEGLQLLERGQERAKELRMESERAPSMNDRQISELRDQIRRFLTERRIEDELGRTIRFQFEPDRLIDMIKNFGEVVPIGKDLQKRASQMSLVSSLDDDGSSSGVGNGKPVSEISSGGICMKSDSMSTEQLAQLTQHLKESLKLQGITEDILPDVSGVAGAMPAPRRRPPTDSHNGQNGYSSGRGRGRGGRRGGGGYRNGAATTRY